MTNDTLFGVNEIYGTNILYPFRIAAPIRKGQTYFSAYNNDDIAASGVAANSYLPFCDRWWHGGLPRIDLGHRRKWDGNLLWNSNVDHDSRCDR